MRVQKLKNNLLADFAEILSKSKLKLLEDNIDIIINQVRIDIILEQIDNKRIEIDTHGGNDIPNI